MLKVDIHTHIIPDNLPDFTKKFGYEGFVRLDKKNKSEADMILFNEKFRTINCNCWNPKIRLNEMEKTDIDLQVISPIPIMFSYWADAKDALEQSQLINDFISKCTFAPQWFCICTFTFILKTLIKCGPGSENSYSHCDSATFWCAAGESVKG